MIQYILTLIIIGIAAGVAVNRLVRFLRDPFSKCDGCAKDCGGCAIEDLKKEIRKEKDQTDLRKNSILR